MRTTGLLLLLFLGACAAGPDAPVQPSGAAPGNRKVVELPPGTILRLTPAEVTAHAKAADASADGDELGKVYLDALWREALRQSNHFDVAAGVEDCAAEHAVALHYDGIARHLATSLLRGGRILAPLASETVTKDQLPQAIDRLALATRAALGEDLQRTQPAVSCVAVLARDPQAVRFHERALREGSRGETGLALQMLRRARGIDPGSPLLAATFAAIALDQGRTEEAERTARQALEVDSRLTPTVKHRLARTILRAAGKDQELLALADVTLVERPHDPQVLYSRALALNFLSRFPESVVLLRRLAVRWPYNAAATWHLAHAELAAGDAEAALRAIEQAEKRLRPEHTLRPKAMALFQLGRLDELGRLLEDAAAKLPDAGAADAGDAREHVLLRMRTSLALLRGDRPRAAELLLEDLEWLRRRPSQLEAHAQDLAEAAEVLVRLGRAADLRARLHAFDAISPLPPIVASALTYAGGLVQLALDPEPPSTAEASLRAAGLVGWSGALRATVLHREGALQAEADAWTEVVQATDSALARAALARVLRSAGQEQQAQNLLTDLRQRLHAIQLRAPGAHPLLSPARALAWLATH